jgi:hypothetical protein
MTLVDEFGAAQLAIQAAVSEAFHTPEVIRLFAQKQPTELRQRLHHVLRDMKLRHSSGAGLLADLQREAGEILIALKRLNVPFTEQEEQLLAALAPGLTLSSNSGSEASILAALGKMKLESTEGSQLVGDKTQASSLRTVVQAKGGR